MRSVKYTTRCPFKDTGASHELYVEGGRLFEIVNGKLSFCDLRFSEATGCETDVLSFYLTMNGGGVVHSPAELAQVRKLLEKEKK